MNFSFKIFFFLFGFKFFPIEFVFVENVVYIDYFIFFFFLTLIFFSIELIIVEKVVYVDFFIHFFSSSGMIISNLPILINIIQNRILT
jgi:hypothetical protein